jgi:hypothetical protein
MGALFAGGVRSLHATPNTKVDTNLKRPYSLHQGWERFLDLGRRMSASLGYPPPPQA